MLSLKDLVLLSEKCIVKDKHILMYFISYIDYRYYYLEYGDKTKY